MAIEEKALDEGLEDGQLTQDEEDDLELTVLLAKQLIGQGGQEVLDAAMKSKDPGQVLGQFLVQLGSQMGEMLPPELQPSPRVMLAEGGWLEQVSDFLQDEYDVSREIADRAEIFVAQAAQDIQKAQAAPGDPAVPGTQPEAAAGPVVPQQGAV